MRELKSPDEMARRITRRLFFEARKKETKVVSITAFVTMLLCYFYEAINGYYGPDAISEGVFFYIGSQVEKSSGRWLSANLNDYLIRGMIYAPISIFVYCFFITMAALVLVRLFSIKKTGYQILLSAGLISFHVVSRHFAFMYVAPYFAFAFLLSVAGVYLVRKRKVVSFIFATFLLLLMLGSYQANIGTVAGLALIMILVDFYDKKSGKETWTNFLLTAGSGALACILDLPILKLTLKGIESGASDRVAQFSLSDIVSNFGFSLKYSYVWFFSYFFEDDVLSRKYLYIALYLVLVALLIVFFVRLIKEKETVKLPMIFIAAFLIPLAMNICQVLFPHHAITDIMRYHYVLLFVLIFALLERTYSGNLKICTEWFSYIIMSVLIFTYSISDNATALCYKLAYESTITQAQLALSQVYALDGYDPAKNTIVFGGTIGYNDTYENFKEIYHYADPEPGPVFWGGEFGAVYGRYSFMNDYLGVNPGWLTVEEYKDVISTSEFNEMPVWPAQGSVKMINGYAVIKFTEYP